MNSAFASLVLMSGAFAVAESLENNKKKKPSMRVNPYLSERKTKGRFNNDFEDLKKCPHAFKENFHVDVDICNEIFAMVQPFLMPKANCRPADEISPEQKFAVVLEYLASGSLQRHMASIYRISKQHFGKIIDDVCDAICAALDEALKPMSKENFLKTANGFNANWQFPNCIGAIDGKHVAVKGPKKAGSLFYNYKGFHSLVLLAVADSQCKFTYVNIGAYGSESDANIFSTSAFGRSVVNDTAEFPPDANVGGVSTPFFFVGDDAFPLCKRILKPYGGRNHLTDEELIFNYRLSRARRCVENAFGVLTARWLCLRRTMFCSPDRAQKIIKACCYLHNYLIDMHKNVYCPRTFADNIDGSGRLIDGEWRRNMPEDSLYANFFQNSRGRQCNIGKSIRNVIKAFVNSSLGAVPW